jgi:hypothetical protein
LKLTAYLLDGHQMDQTNLRFAYRCLPLSIANAHGWEILCPSGFVAKWTGKDDLAAVSITSDSGADVLPAISHFGHGILTFPVPCPFRTEPGFDLMVQGPVNRPKDAIAALTGVVETDWSPYSFTMNWLFTRADTPVWFARGEPICHLFPIRRSDIEAAKPEIRALSSDPKLKDEHEVWTRSREHFNAELMRPGSEAEAQKWQKLYHRGVIPGSDRAESKDHRTRLRIRSFLDKTAQPE